LLTSQFEIIVALIGVTEETANTIEVKNQERKVFLRAKKFVFHWCSIVPFFYLKYNKKVEKKTSNVS
jgi:hypothetical protein